MHSLGYSIQIQWHLATYQNQVLAFSRAINPKHHYVRKHLLVGGEDGSQALGGERVELYPLNKHAAIGSAKIVTMPMTMLMAAAV